MKPRTLRVGGLCEKARALAEPPGDRLVVRTAASLGVYLGGSYLQARDEHFYNVFTLAGPGGQVCGRVPKQKPGSVGDTGSRAQNAQLA